MKSSANIIHNIEKQKGNFIVSIELDNENLKYTLTQYVYKHNIFKKVIDKVEAEKKAIYNSVILAPYFAFEAEKWSKNIWVKIDFWSEQEHEKFKHYFMNKYKDMMK